MAILFCILDGLADFPHPKLNYKTPLEIADIPNIKKLASKSIFARCQTIPDNFFPDSDVGLMNLLGFSPERYHCGRGPAEVNAFGVEILQDDLIWRCNIVGIENNILVSYDGFGISDFQIIPILKKINTALCRLPFYIQINNTFRHLLIAKNAKNSPISEVNIKSPHTLLQKNILADKNIFQQDFLLGNWLEQANFILQSYLGEKFEFWLWGQGSKLQLPDFFSTYNKKAKAFTSSMLFCGLARSCGLEYFKFNEKDKYDFRTISQKIAHELLENDIIFVHMTETDDFSHKKDINGKVQALENFDKYILKNLMDNHSIDKLILTCDHFSSTQYGEHVCGDVPVLIYDLENKAHNQIFSENSTRSSKYFASGAELLKFIF